ncbi:MAG: hypothetical protein LBK67_10610 [Coriobacteriales bacterium]|jgi:Tfp pilus assembly protein PilV|nr:hypothetical protein [Coriobacteriales bacterium]
MVRTALREKCKRVLGSKAGISLIETIVAAAIVAIAALILVSFVYTLTGMSKRSADISAADAELTEMIALDPGTVDSYADMDVTLGDTDITIDTTRNIYETENGEFSTFSYPPTSPGTP